MGIPLLDLHAQYKGIKNEIKTAIDEVLESQHFILGSKVKQFELEISAYCQCKYALGVSSGTDAILLTLMALDIGKGDIVITTPYSFFATVGCIARLGAKPMLVDIDPATFNISAEKLEERIAALDGNERKKIKAVIPVHLFGQMADMESIMKVCIKYNLRVIEDAAQAIGAECMYSGKVKRAGSIGDIGCFSFFPSKNLGAYGDAGMVVTNDEELYNKMSILRSHGSNPKYYHKYIGGNFRLDEIQAAILLVKLKYLSNWSMKRRRNAELYNTTLAKLADIGKVVLPRAVFNNMGLTNPHIFNQYCIRALQRDHLKSYLKEKGIGTEVYYPLSLHLQECFSYLNYKVGDFPISESSSTESLALPVYPEMTEDMVVDVANAVIGFYL